MMFLKDLATRTSFQLQGETILTNFRIVVSEVVSFVVNPAVWALEYLGNNLVCFKTFIRNQKLTFNKDKVHTLQNSKSYTSLLLHNLMRNIRNLVK